jgi:hypothetical protein
VKPLQPRAKGFVFRAIPHTTNVRIVTAPTDYPAPEIDQARDELRQGLEFSRQLIRQSRMLLELTESEGALQADDELFAVN